MTYTLLPIDTTDPKIRELRAAWPEFQQAYTFPRANWLGSMEYLLRELFPQASSEELTSTARSLAPFPLAKPGTP